MHNFWKKIPEDFQIINTLPSDVLQLSTSNLPEFFQCNLICLGLFVPYIAGCRVPNSQAVTLTFKTFIKLHIWNIKICLFQ